MKQTIILSMAVLSLLSIQSCSTEFDNDIKNISVTSGNADFSHYVALGNSLTSGYRDGALYKEGQLESYPAIIAQQMKLTGDKVGDFTQPLMQDNIGGFKDLGVKGKLQLELVNGSLSPVYQTAQSSFDYGTLNGQKFSNLGVPGAKSYHLVYDGYGNPAGISKKTANPYFVRFATSATTSVLKDAMVQNPTFFSLWIGNNDVLGYATSGGDGSDIITPTDTFNNAYTALVATLTSKGAKGVVANIPDVTAIPFFTTIPHNAIPLDEATATQLNGYIGKLQQVITTFGGGERFKTLSKGQNPLIIKDESLKDLSQQITLALTYAGYPQPQAKAIGQIYGQARHATAEDLILLTTKSLINTEKVGVPAPFNKVGITYPLEDANVLTKTEVAEIKTATTAYNATIKALADKYHLAFVDANTKLVELNKHSGIQYDGVTYTSKFVTGGAFSLDGVHLTGSGYAVIANEFIKAINKTYGSTLPQVNVNKYSKVKFP